MARQRFDTAPQFNVSEDSVVIQQVAGSTAPLLELKDHTGSSLMTVSNTGAMTTSVTPSFTNISISGNATIGGNLTVSGNTITLDTETVVIEDKNIVLGNTSIPSNVTADGGGITIVAGIGGNKTFNFVNSTSSWTSSENLDLAANKSYKVNNVDVMCPVGMVVPYAGNSAPSGWLLCSNVAVSRTTYSALFSVIGTTYGSGDGFSTFNLPDLRGRVAVGKDDMGGFGAFRVSSNSSMSGNTIGNVGGSETHTITEAQMPSHTHTQNSHQHGFTNSYWMDRSSYGGAWTDTNQQWAIAGKGFASSGASYSGGPLYFGMDAATATNQYTGNSQAHNNMQPSMVLNYIIKH